LFYKIIFQSYRHNEYCTEEESEQENYNYNYYYDQGNINKGV